MVTQETLTDFELNTTKVFLLIKPEDVTIFATHVVYDRFQRGISLLNARGDWTAAHGTALVSAKQREIGAHVVLLLQAKSMCARVYWAPTTQ